MPVAEPIQKNGVKINIIEAQGKLFALPETSFLAEGSTTGAQKADMTLPPIPNWTDNGVRWVNWGDNDLLPTSMRVKMEKSEIAGITIERKVKMMLGKGLFYYKTADLAKGPEVERAYVQEVEDWLNANRIRNEWWPGQCADFCLPYNCFSEMMLSMDRSKITNLFHISAEHARLGKDNTGRPPQFLVYSYHFPYGTAQNDQTRVAIPLYRWYDHDAFFASLRGRKFAWHTRFPTPGLIYYARAWWMGLFKDGGWMDVSADVPVIVRAMQKNQVALKYQINIPETYFIIRHPDWESYEFSKREELINKKVKELNDYLTGSENVFKSVTCVFKENEISGAPIGKISIEAVDDKAKTGTWVPDSTAADAHIVQGLGMDPSQIGLAPEGGKMGAGSGSDKRESFNTHVELNTPDQQLVLEPLNFISRFNGWGVTFVVDHDLHETKNTAPSGVVKSPQGLDVQPAEN